MSQNETPVTKKSAEEWMADGLAIIEELLLPLGFVLAERKRGNSSGGNFSAATISHLDRSLELHFRYSLGMVAYVFAGRKIYHESLMEAVIGRPRASRYPGFSNDPLQAFRDLRDDLQQYGSTFFRGTDEELKNLFAKAQTAPATSRKLPL